MNERNDSQINEPTQISKNIWIIIIFIVTTALVTGTGVYFWQNSNLKFTEQILQQQISTLQSQITTLSDNNGIKQVTKTQNFDAAFFVRENDDYVLYITKQGKKEKAGLTVPVQQEPYIDSGQTLYRDLEFAAVISPDGKRIAYLAKKDPKNSEQFSLYIANIDGDNISMLARPEWKYGHGSISNNFFWDLNSENIIYADGKGDEGGTTYDIYSINADTLEKEKIVSDSASWNPNEPSTFRNIEIIPVGYFEN